MTLMVESDFDDIVSAHGSGYAICQFEKVQKLDDWSRFQEFLREVPAAHMPYDVVSNNCLHIARRVMGHMCDKWAEKFPGQPPAAWGIVTGDVPRDGENRELGWHALLFAVCEDGVYLAGAQDRSVMNLGRFAEIKTLEYMIVGGG